MTKPIIGITGGVLTNAGPFKGYHRSYVNEDYVKAVIANGGVPLIIPVTDDEIVIKAQIEAVDAVILSGGNDIDPQNYHEQAVHEVDDLMPVRDRFDLTVVQLAEQAKKPILGICRGAQIINVAHGGSLYQDLKYRWNHSLQHLYHDHPDQVTQTISLNTGSKLAHIFGQTKLAINSFHHQAIHQLGRQLTATAWAEDGVIEGFESPQQSIIGVQWHPEMLYRREKSMDRLFQALITQAQGEKR